MEIDTDASSLDRDGEYDQENVPESSRYNSARHDNVGRHNLALRRNFEELKVLYVQLTQANLELQTTCTSLQKEKESLEKKYNESVNPIGNPLPVDPAIQAPQLGMCKEKDEYREGTLEAHKHACVDENATNTIHEKNIIISRLERAVEQFEEHLYKSEQQKAINQIEQDSEVKRLNALISNKERQEQEIMALHAQEIEKKSKEFLLQTQLLKDRHNDIQRNLEAEVTDLQAMLNAIEQASTDAELRHLSSSNGLSKEYEKLKEQFSKLKDEHNLSLEAQSKSQKELSELQNQMIGLNTQLRENQNKTYEEEQQRLAYKENIIKLEKKIEELKMEIKGITTQRKNDNASQRHVLEKLQQNWAAESDAALHKLDCDWSEKTRRLKQKVLLLKKRLRKGHKQRAKLLFERNELLIQMRECEARLDIAHKASKVHKPTEKQSVIFNALPLHQNRAVSMEAEMANLVAQQAKYLDCH